MQTLATRDQLQPTKQQVEAVGVLGIVELRVGVEGPLGHRIPNHKQEVAARCSPSPLSKPPLVRRCEILYTDHRFTCGLRDEPPRLSEMDEGDLGGHIRQLQSEQVDLI